MYIFLTSVSYGRIYCLQVDRIAMLLHTYRFYRDAVVQQVYVLKNLSKSVCFLCFPFKFVEI